MKLRLIALCLLAGIVSAEFSALLAWNGTGHRTIASILFRRLPEARREELAGLLRDHPRYQTDFAEQMPEPVRTGDREMQSEWLLQQASTWPDFVRSGPPERTAFNRPLWHYLPRAFYLTEPEAAFRAGVERTLNSRLEPVGGTENLELNGPQAFLANLKVLNDEGASRADRAVALCWVLHIGQDLHQPCHTSSLYRPGPFAEGDRGANNIKVGERSNLHAVWDGPLGPDERYESCRNAAIVALGDAPAEVLNQPVGTAREEIDRWLAEGTSFERDAVYVGEVRDAVLAATGPVHVTLSADYLRNVRRVSDQRILAAGVRLGTLLHQRPAGPG